MNSILAAALNSSGVFPFKPFIDQCCAQNAVYARTYDEKIYDARDSPSKHLVIICCMDARIDLFRILGLQPGEVHIIQNGGGRLRDAVRSLVCSQALSHTKEVMIIHHTDCGFTYFSNNKQILASLRVRTGTRTEQLNPSQLSYDEDDPDFMPITDLEQSVRDDLAEYKKNPLLKQDIIVRGFTLWTVMALATIEQQYHTLSGNAKERSMIRQSQFTERLTNIEFIHLTDYDDYRLYKLIHKYGSTQAQTFTVNKWLEEYLQESFETPNRYYPNTVQWCSTTMLAFFIRNTTLSMKNINALLLARLEAYDNSKYICYISVLKEHRQNGLGTKLLNEIIKDAIQAKNSRISLHANTENKSALSLYLKCGMRCMAYIPGYYFGDQTYATQNAFTMTLQIKNIKNSTTVCHSTTAVEISSQEEALYKQQCPQAFTG
ncbi:unnamed protein product [Rotaria sordida]|uniref:N-acetyltransferase domain-containing protein n=1 Tax=Rotaria sordida TaxID=392033 RepID=A0A814M662_9BILA|nr:unnamed protein product [Rotaria sordida]